MKFHGVDMQGRFLVEEQASPSFVAADDRRFVRDTDTGDLLLGRAADFEVIISENNIGSYAAAFGGDFHPINGIVTEPIQAATYAGDGTDHVRVLDNWIKLSDGVSISAGGTAGFKIESGNPTSDADDIRLLYDFDSPNDGVYTTKWKLDGGGYTDDPLATHSWVTSAISSGGSGFLNLTSLDARFVRYADAGDSSTNTTWQDWFNLTNATIGDAAPTTPASACRYIYLKNEAHDGFVRTTNWGENSPAGTARYASVPSVANTIVQRDASGDIFANVGHLTATAAQYADLAEKYTCDETLPVGTVVGVMPESKYEVEPYASDKMSFAVGVVSEYPAFLMNEGSDGLPIALVGKVPVRVVGEVKKGDSLIPLDGGTARKANLLSNVDRDRIFATVLEDGLQTEEKLVMCIVK